MSFNKSLFIEDIKGLNGELARDIAIADIEKYLDYDYTAEEIEEMDGAIDELQEEYDELEIEKEKLEKRVKALEKSVRLLEKEKRELRIENLAVGDLLDHIVIEKGIDVFGSGLKP